MGLSLVLIGIYLIKEAWTFKEVGTGLFGAMLIVTGVSFAMVHY